MVPSASSLSPSQTPQPHDLFQVSVVLLLDLSPDLSAALSLFVSRPIPSPDISLLDPSSAASLASSPWSEDLGDSKTDPAISSYCYLHIFILKFLFRSCYKIFKKMPYHDRNGYQEKVEEDYEGYDEYEEDDEPEDEYEQEEVQEEVKPTKEEQDYLKLREQLKEKIRQKLKKQDGSASGHLSQSRDKKRTGTTDTFGSFFGPSQPVIAARVIEESRSIRETKHIVSKSPSSSSNPQKKNTPASVSSGSKTPVPQRQAKTVNEIKNKVQTLKDMRDYSFLFSDDADLPTPKVEPPPRKVPNPNSDGRLTQAPLKSKISGGKPTKLVSNGQPLKSSASTSQHMQSKVGSAKGGAPTSRPKQAPVESRKAVGISNGSVPGRTAAPKAMPSKFQSHTKPAIKPPGKVTGDPGINKKPSLKPQSSIQSRQTEQRKVTQVPNKLKAGPRQPLPATKVQPPKQVLQRPSMHERGSREDRPKKRPARRDYEDDGEDADDAINMIRNMFGYNPNKYARVDEQDDSDMEADFSSIMAEERRSAKIAREEDDEQLRLIEEEERRERLRKKKRLGQR